MTLFKKDKPVEPVGRRRPLAETTNQPTVNPAFSYHAQRSYHPENTGRLDQAQAAERDLPQAPSASQLVARHRIQFGVVVAVLVVAVGYCMILSSQPKIVLLQNASTAYFLQDSAVYQQAASQKLGGSFFNRNKITVDTAALRLSLLKDYPEIKNVSIVMPLVGHQAQVYIEPYKPSFILTTTTSNAFLLDATGRALATTSQISNINKIHVPTVQDRSGIAVTLGNRALPSTTVSFIQTVVASLQANQLTASSLTLPSGAYELDAAISGTGYFVKFNLQGDALQQAGTYLATRGRLVSDHINPTQYIDVRVPERAYYK